MIVNVLEEQIPVVLRLVWNLLLVASGKSDFVLEITVSENGRHQLVILESELFLKPVLESAPPHWKMI